MINDFIKKVAEFHNTFNIKRGDVDVKLRYDLFKEEFDEYKDAKDLVERTDAIVDMLYIACGTLDLYKEDYNCSDSFTNENEDFILECISITLYLYKEYGYTKYIKNVIFYVLELADINNITPILKDLFNEVYRSNMSKLDKEGNPIINKLDSTYYDSRKPIGKILKSELFSEPKLKEILEKHNKLK